KNPDKSLQPPADLEDFIDTWDEGYDPMEELANAKNPSFAIERAKQADAKKKAATPPDPTKKDEPPDVHDEANVISTETKLLSNLADLDKLAPLFHKHKTPVESARTRFQNRLDEATGGCMADPEGQYLLATQQLKIVASIAVGISDAGSRLVD